MPEGFVEWLVNLISTTGVIGVVGFLLRDTVATYLTKAVEHRFEKQIETFKAEIRDNEAELDQIRSFLVSARRERDTTLQAKRLEAAEILMQARQGLSQFSMLIEYMKMLNGKMILELGEDRKIIEFVETLLKPFDVDGILKTVGAIDKTLPRLYLSDKSLKLFNVYESIIMQAVMMMKLYSIPLRDKSKLIKAGTLSKSILELVPGAKQAFDEYGEEHAYYWATYFHDQILRSLRDEVSGADDPGKDTKSIEQLALESRQAQMNIRASLQRSGLPETLLKDGEADAAIPPELQ
jgi:hypothetical protein